MTITRRHFLEMSAGASAMTGVTSRAAATAGTEAPVTVATASYETAESTFNAPAAARRRSSSETPNHPNATTSLKLLE